MNECVKVITWVYLDIEVDLRVCGVCLHVHPLPRVLSFSLLSFYERRGSERAADVEALTFMVAKAWAGVKRHPSLPTAPQNSSTHTLDTHTLLP